MHLSRPLFSLCLIALVTAFVGGCAPPPPPKPQPTPPPAVPTADQAQQIQTELVHFGSAHVGQVAVVSPENKLAAIKNLAETDTKEGETLSILDAQENIIAQSRVVRVAKDPASGIISVIVEFDVAATGRTPRPGDLAVTELHSK